ncbi:MAG: hypothetical protein WBP59_09135, partial [Ilumatobacteraceae bacterium]
LMHRSHRPPDRRLDPVREASCLAHTVPGVSLRLPLANDESLLVSHVCLGADLDPCQLRSALIVDRDRGLPLLTDMITGAEIVSGLVDLGGGLFQRVSAGTCERWFTSTLDPEALTRTLSECPSSDAFDLVIKPDSALGLSAVCVRCLDAEAAPFLDEAATRALSVCLVAELLAGLDGAAA